MELLSLNLFKNQNVENRCFNRINVVGTVAVILVVCGCLYLYFNENRLLFITSMSTASTEFKKPDIRGYIEKRLNAINTRTSLFKIFYYTPFYSYETWFGLGSRPFTKCMYKNCFTSLNQSERNSSDAVLVSMRHLMKKNLPEFRNSHQLWVFVMFESPMHRFQSYSPYNGFFNITLTYKRSSDIFLPHGQVKGVEKPMLSTNIKRTSSQKTKLVAWFVSNCYTQSRRERYVQELNKYIKVDIYGKCGKLKCPKNLNLGGVTDPCLMLLNKTYKFYLSFENSLCKEYITEKLWRTLKLDVVPVVLGAADYSDVLPPKSYIDVRDFASPRSLADYLQYLDRNPEEYEKFFAWKRQFTVTDREPMECKICEYLNKHSRHQFEGKTVARLDLFWNKNKDCERPKTFYKNIANVTV